MNTMQRFGNKAIALTCAAILLSSCATTKAAEEKGVVSTTFNLPGGVPLEMVDIPAGSFSMGNSEKPDESPAHTVTIDYTFQLGKLEVTQKQWFAVMNRIPEFQPADPDLPVVFVSWADCQSFITALNGLGQGTFRLPSEAEWEYACRAGTTTHWSHRDAEAELENYAWYSANSGDNLHVVGRKLPNAFGLYDMHGNALEWVQDWYHSGYIGAPNDGSAWENPAGEGRVVRGGNADNAVRYLRSAYREPRDCRPSSHYNDDEIGFRLLREK